MSEVHEKNNAELFLVIGKWVHKPLPYKFNFCGKKKTIGVLEGNVKCVFRDIGFFVGDGSARKLIVVIVAKLYEYGKHHWSVYFKWMNYMVCKLYLNKLW